MAVPSITPAAAASATVLGTGGPWSATLETGQATGEVRRKATGSAPPVAWLWPARTRIPADSTSSSAAAAPELCTAASAARARRLPRECTATAAALAAS